MNSTTSNQENKPINTNGATSVKGKKPRIFYFDALRALAIVSVIIIHVYTLTRIHIMGSYGIIPSFEWIYTQIVGNTFRIGVDLFLVLSGALSLGRVWSIKSFLGKRIPRIIEPFLFWGLFLSAILILLSYFFNYPYLNSFDIYSILNFVYGAFMAKSLGFAPYWFFWMILGTYLIMPIFNKWILHSELGELEYFLAIWLITCLFTFTLKSDFPVKLSYFTSPIGLVVLGYYLRYTERKILNNPYFGIFLILLSSGLMLMFSYIYSSTTSFFNFDRYSFLTAFVVIGVFILFKNFNELKLIGKNSKKTANELKNDEFINIQNNKINSMVSSSNQNSLFRKFVFSLAKYSYGIYLIHTAILSIIFRTLNYSMFGNYNLYVISLFLLDLFISLIVMSLFNRIPYVNRVIGAK